MSGLKQITFTKKNGGGSYLMDVIGDPNKMTWGSMDGQTIYDTQLKSIVSDAKADGYKIIIN